MSESAKKLTTLDDLVENDHIAGLKSLIVAQASVYPPEELFEVRFDETRLGPIWNQDLKAYVAQDANFPVSCLVSQFAAEDWMPLLQHPFFQRRRPQLVARNDLNIESETFVVLREGKKLGPYTAAQVQEKLAKNEIMVSDQVSTDGGHSWGRLYEIEDFDRRNIVSSSELPFMPEWQVFNNSFDEVEQGLGDMGHNMKAMETDAIASLAYLENLQSGKAGASTVAAKNGEENSPAPFPKFVIAVVAAMGLGLALAAWYASRPSTPSATSNQQVDNAPRNQARPANTVRGQPIAPSRLGQDAKRDSTPISERVINKVRQPANKPASSSSFRKSRAFKNSVAPANESDFSYNQDRPLEQDPIGSKLSKESINPDDDYQRELRDEGYDAEPNYANDRFENAEAAEEDFAKLYENEGGVGESGNGDQVSEDGYDNY